MKKFIVALMLLFPSVCFSELKGFIEPGKDIDYNIAYTELQIGYNFKVFNIEIMPYGNQQTWFEYNNKRGYPFRDIYTIGSEFKFSNITIDFSHFCSHKVMSLNSEENFTSYESSVQGASTRLAIRYDF